MTLIGPTIRRINIISMHLRQIVVLSRDLVRSKAFYEKAIGLQLLRSSDTFVEFALSSTDTTMTLALKQASSEAECCTGYSPILTFAALDMSETITKAISYGAILDGPIKYPAYGKLAAMRSPEGIMLGLYETEGQDN